ncbi:MAG: lipoate--protein ligase family protein [Bacteroidales bacterium]|nr:lipoate--protein ligase family protein [Bacteroidales bacterium]
MTKYRYIQENDTSASYGLAADEFLMNCHQNDAEFPATLRLYNYQDYAVLAGRFQDINAEINIEACKQNGFQYGRRLTGGGAILMGSEQLGICFATSSKTFEWENIRELYHKFSIPVINALAKLGIEAEFRSKNDLEVNGKKIAGLGVHVDVGGMIQFHTSLLIDLDINKMLKVLKIPIQKYSDKRKIASIEQRITTISRELDKNISKEEVIGIVKLCFAEAFDIDFVTKEFSLEEKQNINKLEKNRYLTEEWIYQRSPQSDMTGMSLKKTPAGLLRTYIGLKGETIKSVLITGDFFEQANIFSRIESELKWSSMDKENIRVVVKKVFQWQEFDSMKYGLTVEMIVESIWLAAQRAMAAERYTYKGSCYYPKKEIKKKTTIKG